MTYKARPPVPKEEKVETFRLTLSLDEAQDLFDLVGNSVLPKQKRKKILPIYRKFEREGFIPDEL